LIRQIVQDFAVLEDSKIIQDDDKFLVVKAVIASEIVYKYKDNMAYKPVDELEKAAWTTEGKVLLGEVETQVPRPNAFRFSICPFLVRCLCGLPKAESALRR
jgi:hypothetical protein